MNRRVMKRMAAAVTSVGLLIVGVSAMALPASGGTPVNPPFPMKYFAPPGTNTYSISAPLTPQCPDAIADTPGSDPATLEIDQVSTGTVVYKYLDNTLTPEPNFAVQVCTVVYPASAFPAGLTAAGVPLGSVSKKVLDGGAPVDGADLDNFATSTSTMYFGWKIHGVQPGQIVCSFARDKSNGHGGGGNRKSSPVCFQVPGSPTPSPTPSLELTKSVDSTTVTALPAQVTYTLTVTNTSTTAVTNVVLSDAAPQNETFLSGHQSSGTATLGCTTSSSAVSCTATNFAPGASAVYSVIARILSSAPNNQSVVNIATVTADNVTVPPASVATLVNVPPATPVVGCTTACSPPSPPGGKPNPSVLPDVTPTATPPAATPPAATPPAVTPPAVTPAVAPPTVAGPTVTPVVREVLPVTALSPSAIPTRVLGENGQRLAFTGANVRLLLEAGLMLIVMGMGFLYAAKRPGVHSR